MTPLQREALQMCLEYIETDAHERRHVRWKINEALAQQEIVAWMHEWEDGEKIPMLKGRDDRNQDKPKTVRPLVYGDTSPQPAQPQQELEYCTDYHCAGDCGQPHNQKEMREFLASQPQHQPVAIVAVDGVGQIQVGWITKPQHNDKLYTQPPARKPLMDEEIGSCIDEVNLTSQYGHHHFGWHKQFARAVEAAHGITGEQK